LLVYLHIIFLTRTKVHQQLR